MQPSRGTLHHLDRWPWEAGSSQTSRQGKGKCQENRARECRPASWNNVARGSIRSLHPAIICGRVSLCIRDQPIVWVGLMVGKVLALWQPGLALWPTPPFPTGSWCAGSPSGRRQICCGRLSGHSSRGCRSLGWGPTQAGHPRSVCCCMGATGRCSRRCCHCSQGSSCDGRCCWFRSHCSSCSRDCHWHSCHAFCQGWGNCGCSSGWEGSWDGSQGRVKPPCRSACTCQLQGIKPKPGDKQEYHCDKSMSAARGSQGMQAGRQQLQ